MPNPSEDRACDVAAAEWLAALRLGTADEDAFEAWRARDPRHAVAFARIAAAWQAVEDRAVPKAAAAARLPRRLMLGGAVAAGVAAVLGAGFRVRDANARDHAETGVGESRRIAIAPGTWLILNTDSAVAWKIGPEQGTLWLERGEIAIESARAPLRLYQADRALFLAPGRYNAACREAGLDLLVLDGRAGLAGGGAAGSAQLLRLRRDSAEIVKANAARIEAAAAWPMGEVVFEDVPLSEAVREYNRYLARKLVLADPALGALRIGGRFHSHDPKQFLEALAIGLDLTATPGRETILLATAK